MMFPSIFCSSLETRFQTPKLLSILPWPLLLLSTQSHTCSQSITTLTATLTDLRYMLLRTEDIRNSERRHSKLTRPQVTGSDNTPEHLAVTYLSHTRIVFAYYKIKVYLNSNK